MFMCMSVQWIGYPDENGDTALHVAALNGHAECIGPICDAAWEW
jgi:ankyrin repeat protein